MVRRGALAGLALLALLLVIGLSARWRGERNAETQEAWPVPPATPIGIRLQPMPGARLGADERRALADAQGLSLYVHAGDRPGHATCSGPCGTVWPPALAAPGAQATGEWSLLVREDGTRQWAYAGAPLYRFASDRAVGEAGGVSAASPAWQLALFDPAAHLRVPDGIAVHELADAGGVGLVDAAGLTLYAATRPEACQEDAACRQRWLPAQAAQLAAASGDFAPRLRDDGITQWSFRGRLLYRYAGDQRPGDVAGSNTDPRFQVALILRYFMPQGVRIRERVGLGAVLVTTADATLYQRDRVRPDDSHNFRLDHGTPALGRLFGTAACDSLCTREWRPLLAPAGALGSGFWEIMRRQDGRSQWAYKGFALYTYREDRRGEARGNEQYQLASVVTDDSPVGPAGSPLAALAAVSIDQRIVAGSAASGVGVSALFWHATTP